MSGRSLADQLAELRSGASAESRKLYDALVKHLEESGALDGALKAGATFPDFQLVSADGRFVTRDALLAKGPAVIVFDRGSWCPYCRAVLRALNSVAEQIRDAGATLTAITPEAGGAALRVKVDASLDYEVLCDLDSTLALECGLVFPVSDELREAYLARGIDLAKLFGTKAWMLPAPATFVVRKDATVAAAQIAIDFRHRQDPKEILRILSGIV